MRDKYHDFYSVLEIASTTGIVDAGINGNGVDMQGYDSLTFNVLIGKLSSITSASYWVIRMQHTDASALGLGASDYANCEGSHVLGSGFSLATVLTSGIVLSIFSDTGFSMTADSFGYRGNKRYVRLVLEEKGNLSTADIMAVSIRGRSSQWPAADSKSVTL
jgi:hypothetical protein